MRKLPGFVFYPGDGLKDPELRGCSPGARGTWIDMLCMMWESSQRGVLRAYDLPTTAAESEPDGDRNSFESRLKLDRKRFESGLKSGRTKNEKRLKRPRTIDEIAAMLGFRVQVYIRELINKGVVSVARKDGSLYCRRMIRDELHRRRKAQSGRKGGKRTLSKPEANREANTQANVEDTVSVSSKEEKKKKKQKKQNPPNPPEGGSAREIIPPLALNTPRFRDAWNQWEAHRREKRRALTPSTRKKQLVMLAKMGEELACQAIEESIKQGWQGLFEPKGPRGSTDNAEKERQASVDAQLARVRAKEQSNAIG